MSQQQTPVPQVYQSLLRARIQFKPIIKNKTNPHYKSRYADLETVLDAVEGPLGEHGLLIVQRPEVRTEGTVLVTEVISVTDGSRMAPAVYPIKSANDSDPQKVAAAMTYARRYSILMVLGLAPEDDDGETASRPAAAQEARPAKTGAPTQQPRQATPPQQNRPPANGTAQQRTRPANPGQVIVIGRLAVQLGVAQDKLAAQLKADFGVASPDKLNEDQAHQVIGRMEAALKKRGG